MNSSELKGYLTGLIIGDGYIDHGVTKRAFRVKSVYKDFISKIYDDLSSCTNFNILIKEFSEKFYEGCSHEKYWELTVKAHPYFNKKYHHFYNDNRKRQLSKEAASWLSSSGLANWYMLNGYICLIGKSKGIIRDRRIEICTDKYTFEDVNKLSIMLKNKFNLNSSVIKRGKTYRIRILKSSYESFICLVKPYIVKSMEYKLYLGYEYQPKWMSNDLWDFQEYLRSAIAQTDKAVG